MVKHREGQRDRIQVADHLPAWDKGEDKEDDENNCNYE